MRRREHRVVVATCDPITARMAGPAIRAWHMAEVLAAEHDVQLVTTEACERSHPRFPVRRVGSDDLRELERWMDVLVFQGGLLRIHPFLLESDKVIVADLYDPFHLENLEQTRGRSPQEREATIRHLTGVLNEQLERADFFLCASMRQRDFWLGSLAALGRVNPATYDEDETLSSLVAVVPFGLPCDPPARTGPALRGVVPGIGPDDHVVLWAGGVYNWFDPLTLVRAVDRLRRRLPTVRLYFLGLQHPNPNIPEMRTAGRLRSLAGELGLTGRHVFFNEGWVDYDARAGFLLDADVGVSTHLDHVETSYSFRTRILDYLWAGLPVVATGGDALGELIEREALGLTVPADDVEALESALERLLGDEDLANSCRQNVARVAPSFRWSEVLAPLVGFVRSPRRAPDLARPPAAVPAPPSPAPSRARRPRRPGRGARR
jgi:glycosyltransferase involved in cell wall biosynthesis